MPSILNELWVSLKMGTLILSTFRRFDLGLHHHHFLSPHSYLPSSPPIIFPVIPHPPRDHYVSWVGRASERQMPGRDYQTRTVQGTGGLILVVATLSLLLFSTAIPPTCCWLPQSSICSTSLSALSSLIRLSRMSRKSISI